MASRDWSRVPGRFRGVSNQIWNFPRIKSGFLIGLNDRPAEWPPGGCRCRLEPPGGCRCRLEVWLVIYDLPGGAARDWPRPGHVTGEDLIFA